MRKEKFVCESIGESTLETTSFKHSGEMIKRGNKNDYHTSNIAILCTVKREAKEKIFKSAVFFTECVYTCNFCVHVGLFFTSMIF